MQGTSEPSTFRTWTGPQAPGIGPTPDSDEEIERFVGQFLEYSLGFDRGEVGVHVADGWVSLFGTVDCELARDTVVHGVRRLLCVRGVTNALEIHHK